MKSLLGDYDRIVIVSYRLPFRLQMVDGVKKVLQNSGGLVSAIAALSEQYSFKDADVKQTKLVWVGKGEQEDIDLGYSDATGTPFSIEPVSIDEDVNELYYAGFSNKLIWPLFHYFQNYAVYDDRFYEAFVAAQKKFLDKVLSVVTARDFIWIHDYQLMLLPGMLREQMPQAGIGFFLHIPFPSFEIFRTMKRPWREAILKGILGADLIGFQVNDYAQYFLRAVSRTLGYEARSEMVVPDGRMVKVDAFPIGIDYKKFERATQSIEVKHETERLKENLHNMKLIFSIDRLDYTKGFLNRLQSYEAFLTEYPQWHEKVVFNMIVIPSRDTIGSYQEMKKEIEALVGRINGTFSNLTWRPVVYQYRSVSFNELVALYQLSDVALITPLRDGMNLVCKEFVACQTDLTGVLVLSEMAGSADELSDALLINPTDNNEMSFTINRALSLSLRERRVRMDHMQKRLRNYDVFSWAQDSIESMQKVKRNQQMRQIKVMDTITVTAIVGKYQKASQRIVFMDYDGTLVPFSRFPDLAVPTEQTISLIDTLAKDPHNCIVIISGRVCGFLEEHFGALNVHLVAEHGGFVKKPGGVWVGDTNDGKEWKDILFPVLQRYSDHCAGSFVEEKTTSLAWHFRNADAELAAQKTNQLREELHNITANNPHLYIMDGHKVIEIRRTGFDKGSAALTFLGETSYDFIMAIGDDKTDEDLFRVLPQDAITVKVGMIASHAKYNLKNQADVSEFMGRLVCSAK